MRTRIWSIYVMYVCVYSLLTMLRRRRRRRFTMKTFTLFIQHRRVTMVRGFKDLVRSGKRLCPRVCLRFAVLSFSMEQKQT